MAHVECGDVHDESSQILRYFTCVNPSLLKVLFLILYILVAYNLKPASPVHGDFSLRVGQLIDDLLAGLHQVLSLLYCGYLISKRELSKAFSDNVQSLLLGFGTFFLLSIRVLEYNHIRVLSKVDIIAFLKLNHFFLSQKFLCLSSRSHEDKFVE